MQWLQAHWPGAPDPTEDDGPQRGPAGRRASPQADARPARLLPALQRASSAAVAVPFRWLQANWPGRPAEAEPEGGAPVYGPPLPSYGPPVPAGAAATDVHGPPVPSGADEPRPESAAGPVAGPRLVAVADDAVSPPAARAPGSRRRRLRRAPRAGVRRVGTVARALYAALADPITGADEAARERRAARVRQVGRVAVSGALAVVLVYAMFPVREYLDQRAAMSRREDQLEIITEENDRQAREVEELSTPEEIQRRARIFGMVFPDEDTYTLLPPAEE